MASFFPFPGTPPQRTCGALFSHLNYFNDIPPTTADHSGLFLPSPPNFSMGELKSALWCAVRCGVIALAARPGQERQRGASKCR
jgi:hypothetical protein